MKKSLLMLLCLLLALPFAYAEEAAPTEEPALPCPVFEWERNGVEHWHVLDNGEKTDIAAHTLDDSMLCTVCGSEVWLFDALSAEVYDYDAFGNLVRQTSFDEEGVLTYEAAYTLTYDENNNLIHSLEFVNDVLFGESTFALSPEGDVVPVTQLAWYDDGTWALNEYDEYGNCIRSVSYDADDSILAETISEFKRDAWGWFYEAQTTTTMDDSVFYSEHNEYGDKTRSYMTEGGVAWSDHVYEYGYQNGSKLWCKDYSEGRLYRESVYDQDSGMLIKETEYLEDGTKSVSEYNLIGDPLSIVFFLADGTVDMTQAFEYVYDEHSTMQSCKAFVNGVLVLHTEYAFDEYGWNYVARETLYNGDGSYLVCTYDENEEIVSEIGYDANGNVIE